MKVVFMFDHGINTIDLYFNHMCNIMLIPYIIIIVIYNLQL